MPDLRNAVFQFRSGNTLVLDGCDAEHLKMMEERISDKSNPNANSWWVVVDDTALINLAGVDYVELVGGAQDAE